MLKKYCSAYRNNVASAFVQKANMATKGSLDFKHPQFSE